MGSLDDGLVLGLGFTSNPEEIIINNNTNNNQRLPIKTSCLSFEPSLSLSLSAGAEAEAETLHRQAFSPHHSTVSSFSSGRVKRERDLMMISTTGDQEGILEGDDQRVSSSRTSDEDEDGNINIINNSKKKLRLTKEQSALLEESFKHHPTLNPKQKQALARQLKLRPRQVEVWFQNRRARTKLKQTEVDCELLKKCCETLTDENRRLQKEVQELKALKLAQPFYMHNMAAAAAATLTMCPSCERIGDGGGGGDGAPKTPFSLASKPHHYFNPFSNPSAAC